MWLGIPKEDKSPILTAVKEGNVNQLFFKKFTHLHNWRKFSKNIYIDNTVSNVHRYILSIHKRVRPFCVISWVQLGSADM